jgi:hypothetical protein
MQELQFVNTVLTSITYDLDVNLLSTALLVALIALGGTALALSLNEPAASPPRSVIYTAGRPPMHREYVPAPCPPPDQAAANDAAVIDPGILVPTPDPAFRSQMRAGSTSMCYAPMPLTR